MDIFAHFITRRKKLIIIIFIILAILSIGLQFFVQVNYNMADYLPPDAQSTTGLAIMGDEFDEAMPNTNVMIRNVTIMEAMEYKEEMQNIAGVSQVLWLDSMVDIREPLEISDTATVETFYRDNTALYQVTIADGMEQQATEEIRQLIGEEGAVAGESPNLATMQDTTIAEVLKAAAILVPIIFCILLLSTSSGDRPVLFLLTIGLLY